MSAVDSPKTHRVRLDRVLAKRNPTPIDLRFVCGSGIGALRELLITKCGFVLKSIPNQENEAEDVVQEFLLEIGKVLKAHKGESSLGGYLVACLLNKCKTRLSKIAKDRVKRVSLPREESPSICATTETPILVAAEKEDRQIQAEILAAIQPSVRRFIEQLTESEKLILRLRYGPPHEKVDWTTIGTVLRVKSATAKRKRDRMRKRIENALLSELLRESMSRFGNETITGRIMFLSVIEGRDYAAIAQELAIDERTVSRRVRRFSDSFLEYIVHANSSLFGVNSLQSLPAGEAR